MKKIFKFLATGFHVGLIPGAPGTYGSVIGVILYLLLNGLPLISYILFCIAFTFLAFWITKGALPQFRSKDPGAIVIDEIAGMVITMIGIPFTWINVGLGFLIFRVFDVVKPFPVSYCDKKIKGAWGVVLDDVVAGIYACIVLWLVNIYIFG